MKRVQEQVANTAGRRTRSGRARARRSERGAQLVEFALVVPIFLLLIMGVIDFGVALNEYNSVRSGVAEASRQGVVANFDSSGCTGTSSQRLACLTDDRIGLDGTKVKLVLPGGYSVGESLRVCAMHDVESMTGMFGPVLDGAVAKTSMDMRIERLDDANPLVAFEETPLSGQDWSWC